MAPQKCETKAVAKRKCILGYAPKATPVNVKNSKVADSVPKPIYTWRGAAQPLVTSAQYFECYMDDYIWLI